MAIGRSLTHVGDRVSEPSRLSLGFTRSHKSQQIEHTMLFGIMQRRRLPLLHEADRLTDPQKIQY